MIGKTLGPYTLTDRLGAGGMGEVYRAHDGRLDREVAIKVLPAGMATDADAMSRFETEARAVAALSHPNIIAVFDVGQGDGTAYVVTELLEGAALSDLLLEGPLPYRKAADYARDIALGLAAAHDRDIVHRDVKPANVFITSDGRVKLLDFGLAKDSSLMSSTNSDSIQATVVGTEPGTILGTVGYMAPEQVRGESADARSDIFALGSVLFEMLDGRAAFKRDTSAETMTAILREEPPASSSNNLPRSLERVVRHCMEKRPDDRFQTARDLAFAIDNASVASGSDIQAPAAAPTAGAPAPRASWMPAIGLATLAAVAGLAAGLLLDSAPPATQPARLRQVTFSGLDYQPSASRDGRLIAFRSLRGGTAGIWVKQLSTGGERRLTSGEDATPRFHPSGDSVLFSRLSDTQVDLHRIGLLGEQPRRLVSDAFHGDWSPDGNQIAFVRLIVPDALVAIYDLETGTERELFRVEGFALEHPRYSPDGRTVSVTRLPTTNAAGGQAQILIDVATGEASALPSPTGPAAMTGAAWTASGDALIFGLAPNTTGDRTGLPGRVVRQEIATGEVTTLFWASGLFPQRGDGAGFGVVERVGNDRVAVGLARVTTQLSEVEIGGDQRGRPLTVGDAQDRQPVYSPDGSRVLFSSNRSGNLDLWTVSPETLELTQVTDDSAQDWDPAYTPDGRNIIWSSDRSGELQIWMADADGNGPRQITNIANDAQNPTMTADGEWIVYASTDPVHLGLRRVRPDGSEDTGISSEVIGIPQVGPADNWVAYGNSGRSRGTDVRIIDAVSGEFMHAETPIYIPPLGISGGPMSAMTLGRPRWIDEETLAFVAQFGDVPGIWAMDLVSEGDVATAGRVLVEANAQELTESFGLSPDGRFITVALQRASFSLAIADQVEGLE